MGTPAGRVQSVAWSDSEGLHWVLWCQVEVMIRSSTAGGSTSMCSQPIPLPVCRACFASWWQWQQQQQCKEAQQLEGDLGPAAAASKLQERGLVPDPHGLFTILCPACRWAVSLTAVRKPHERESAAARHMWRPHAQPVSLTHFVKQVTAAGEPQTWGWCRLM